MLVGSSLFCQTSKHQDYGDSFLQSQLSYEELILHCNTDETEISFSERCYTYTITQSSNYNKISYTSSIDLLNVSTAYK